MNDFCVIAINVTRVGEKHALFVPAMRSDRPQVKTELASAVLAPVVEALLSVPSIFPAEMRSSLTGFVIEVKPSVFVNKLVSFVAKHEQLLFWASKKEHRGDQPLFQKNNFQVACEDFAASEGWFVSSWS